MRRDNPWMIPIVAAIVSGLIVGLIVSEIYEHKEEDLLKSYGKRYRTYIKRIKQSNVLTIGHASTVEEYEKLYGLYKKSFRYWGDNIRTNYTLNFFKNFYDLTNKSLKLWTAYYDNKMIGGEVMLYWNDYCTGFVSYYDREYSKIQARRCMLHNIFLHCMEKGIKYYDFMQSGGIKGVEDFKRSMGGRKYTHSAWLNENNILKILRNIKGSIKSFYKQ